MFSQLKSLRLFKLFLIASFSLTLLACGGGADDPAGDNLLVAPVVVGGTVVDGAGEPVAGASVQAAGQSVVTAGDGSYSLTVTVPGESTVVLVKRQGYTTTAKEVPLSSGDARVTIQIFSDQINRAFSAATGASISVNGATVQIPANAIKTASGADFTGTVTISASYYSPDTVQGAQAFAGPYTGTDAGVSTPIISMGFVEVKLADAAGSPLQLKAGSPATLNFPASSNSAGAATVPMWFYDETAKTWVREGTATKQANGTYSGTVTHFTLWNVDFIGLTATIQGCFQDAAGARVTNVGVSVGLRATGWSRSFGGRSTNGDFTIRGVPANVPMELYSGVAPVSFTTVQIPALAPNEVRVLPCIIATPSVSRVVVPPATVFVPPTTINPGGPTTQTPLTSALYAGTYTGTFSGSENGTFNVLVNAAGGVSGSSTSTTSGTVGVTGQVASDGNVSLTASGTAGAAIFRGTVTTGGSLSGTWSYANGFPGGGTFGGQRAVTSATLSKYVGTWAGCVRETDGNSLRINLTFSAASATALNFYETSSIHSGPSCAGASTFGPTNGYGTAVFDGTKTIGSSVADKLAVAFSLPASSTSSELLLVSGSTLYVGNLDGPLDANGYPNQFELDTLTKQ
jgi:hypothetical protein